MGGFQAIRKDIECRTTGGTVRQKCASSSKYTYIQNIVYLSVCAQVYTWFTHEESDWYNTYMSLLMHLGKYIRILLTCCESMWNHVEPVSLHRHKNVFNASRKQSSNISQTYIESLP